MDGLYTDDPALNPDATFIPRIGAQALIDLDLHSLVLDRALIPALLNARFIKEVQVVNGLVPGNVTRALNGEHVCTLITQEA